MTAGTKWTILIGAISLTWGCGSAQRQAPVPQPPQPGGAQGRWQIVAFQPSDDTEADGAILLDTATGQSYVLCDYATAWCKLDRSQ